jgi:archaellum component FlaC
MIRKIEKMYPKRTNDYTEEIDHKFEKMLAMVDRVSKSVSRHNTSLNHLDAQVQILVSRKEYR